MGTNSCRLTRRGSELCLSLVHTTLRVTEPTRAPCGQSLGRGELAAHGNQVGKEQTWSRGRETGSTFPGRRGHSPGRREQRQGRACHQHGAPLGRGGQLRHLGFCPEAALVTWKTRNQHV